MVIPWGRESLWLGCKERKLNIGVTLAAFLVFFLPWIDISCSQHTLATQSGFQTITGGATVTRELRDEFAKKAEKSDESDNLGTSILALAAIAALVGAIMSAAAALNSEAPGLDNLVGIFCAVALGLLILQGFMGFPVKEALRETGGMVQIKYLPAYFLELGLLALPAIRSFNRIMDKSKSG